MVCWAECLGGCDTTQSREHVISKSLFLTNTVIVKGFHWCADTPIEIGIASLTAKILCKSHNSGLSDLDSSGAHAFDQLREMTRLKNVREGLKPHRWTIKTYYVDGELLERWLLKTLINIGYGKEHPIGGDATMPGKPSDRLVRIAFGKESFQGRAGMYTVARVGMDVTLEDRVSFDAILNGDSKVVGGLFRFRGITLLLSLEPEGIRDLRGFSFKGDDLSATSLIFQTLNLNILVGKYLSHVLRIQRPYSAAKAPVEPSSIASRPPKRK